MRHALSVRINDGYSWRTVTKRASGVGFTKQAPGGYVDGRFHLAMPTNAFIDLGQADLCAFDDIRTGRPIWDGFIKAPTPQSGRAGQSWDVTAVGGTVVASDQSRPLIYVDRSLDRWTRAASAPSAITNTGPDPDEALADGVYVQFASGTPVGTNSQARMTYNAFRDAGMQWGALRVVSKSGKVDTGYRNYLRYGDGIPGGVVGDATLHSSTNINTTPVTNNRWVGESGHPPAGTTVVQMVLRRVGGATNVNDDNTWTLFSDPTVLGRRMDRYGNLVTGTFGMISNSYVRADWVVEDLLGRVLTMCDANTAVVEAATYQIDQLAYFDGVKPSALLDDLLGYESSMLWEIKGLLPNGKRQFAFRYWPTSPRYVLGSDVDIEEQGSDVDLANRVLITWTDTNGATTTQAFGQEVTALGSGSPVTSDGMPNGSFTGRVVDVDPITLPEGKGSLSNATQIAAVALAAVSGKAPPAAKATVGYRVYDRVRNMFVEPHEIEPGYLARRLSTGDDLRVTNVDYSDDDGVGVLDLGVPAATVDQRVAQLAKVA